MSNVDERIVALKFDNTGFEAGAAKAIGILGKLEQALKFDSASSGLETVKNSINNFSLDGLSSGIEACKSRFGSLGDYVSNLFFDIESRLTNFATSMAQKLTVEPMVDGFKEYETQMNSVQTILSNAGDKLKEQGFETQEEQIAKINDTLDELNTYADKTIYNFSEMTRNIGTFTAAGVDLDTATASIQGIANLAAASGSNSQQASTAMYQLSQAIAAGSVKLQDWNSVVNAGMGGELFQNALKRTARAHGVAVDEMIEKNGSFRESLQEGWITSDILTETLNQLTMSYEEVGDEAYKTNFEILRNQGYSKEDAEAILELAHNAEKAATKVRTWTQLWDTVGEALGSGWAATWRLIVGDFIEATDLFTHISEAITGVISDSSNARIAVLTDWADAGGRTALVDGIKYTVDAIESVVRTIGEAFSDVFGISGEQLFNLSVAFKDFASGLVPSQEAVQFLYDVLYDVFTIIHSVIGVIGNAIRIIASVASIVWKVISPFAKLALLLAGGVAKGLAILSSFILLVTDYIQGFIDLVMGSFGNAIDFIGSLVGDLGMLFSGIGGMISGAVTKYFVEFASAIWEFAKTLPILSSVGGFLENALGSLLSFASSLITVNEVTDKSGEKIKQYSGILASIGGSIFSFFESIYHSLYDFRLGLEMTDDKVGYITQSLGESFHAITSSVRGFFDVFSSPRKFYDAIENLSDGLVDFIYNTFSDRSVADSVHNFVFGILRPLKLFFRDSIGESKTWSEVFGINLSTVTKPFKIIKKAFSDLVNYFKTLFSSGKSIPEIVTTLFTDTYNVVSGFVVKIPDLLTKAKSVISQKWSDFINSMSEGDGNSIWKSFVDFFKNPPSPQEVMKSIGDFIEPIRAFISEKISNLFSIGGDSDKPNSEGFLSTIKHAFSSIVEYIAGVKIEFPDVGSMFAGFWDFVINGLHWVADTIPVDDISEALNYVIEKLKNVVMNQPWVIALAGVVDFIHSLSTLNKGVGGFGKNLAKFGKSISEGLGSFGEGFTKFKQQTKADAFKKIATGILILAAALWVMAQIPSERLMDVSLVLGGFALGIAAITAVLGGLAKWKDLDFESIGKSLAGFGIGLLALAGAVWVMAQIPAEEAKTGMDRVCELIVIVGVALTAISATGGNLQGAAGTLIALAVSILLLLIPVQILARTPDEVLKKGYTALFFLMAFVTAAVSIMERASKSGSSIAGAAPTLLALAVSINLLMIPVFILGTLPLPIVAQGVIAVGVLAVFLGLAIGLMGRLAQNTGPILAATPALLALALSITLLALPVNILGNLDLGLLAKGVVAVGVLGAVLAGCVVAIGALATNVGAIVAGTVAIVALTVCITLLSLVVVGISKLIEMNPGAMLGGVVAVLALVGALAGGLAALSAFGVGAGVGLLVIAAGILVFSASLVALADAIAYLQNTPDWQSIVNGIQSVVSSIGETARNIVDNFVSSVKGFFGNVAEAASSLVNKFIDSVKSFFGINSPSTVMADIGGNVVQGLINGIGEFVGSLGSKAGELGKAVLDGIASLPGNLLGKAGEAGKSLVSGIGGFVGSAGKTAGDLANSVVGGAKNLASDLGKKASDAASGFVKKISGSVGSAKNAATSLANGVTGALSGLASSMKNKAIEAAKGMASGLSSNAWRASNAAGSLRSSAISGLGSMHGSFYNIGANGAAGLVDGLRSKVQSAANAAADLARKAAETAKAALKINSPSKVFRDLGYGVGEGFVLGIGRKVPDVVAASTNLADNTTESFESALDKMSVNIDDILDTDYNPVITPVIDSTQFDSGMNHMSSLLNERISGINIGNLNYTGELSAKIGDYADINRQTLDMLSNGLIDYDVLGASVANALIRSGVHVEMDGGKVMGYIAGEIRDVRRMYK